MNKNKTPQQTRVSNTELNATIIFLIIAALYILVISIGTQGSLAAYTLPQLITSIIVVCLLLAKSKISVRIALILSILSAVAALVLVILFLPYYLS